MAILPPADAESQTPLSDKALLPGERSEPPVPKGVGEVKNTVAAIAEEGLFSKSKRENTKIGFFQVVFRVIPMMVKNFFVYVFNIIFCCRRPKCSYSLNVSIPEATQENTSAAIVMRGGKQVRKIPKDHLHPLKVLTAKEKETISEIVITANKSNNLFELGGLRGKQAKIEDVHTLRFLECVFDRRLKVGNDKGEEVFQSFCDLMNNDGLVPPKFRKQTAKRLQGYNAEDPAKLQQLLRGFTKVILGDEPEHKNDENNKSIFADVPTRKKVNPDKLLEWVPSDNSVEGWIAFLRYITDVRSGQRDEDLVDWAEEDYRYVPVSPSKEDFLDAIFDATYKLELVSVNSTKQLLAIDKSWESIEDMDSFTLLFSLFGNDKLYKRVTALYGEPSPTNRLSLAVISRRVNFINHLVVIMKKKPLSLELWEELVKEINKARNCTIDFAEVRPLVEDKRFSELLHYIISAS